MLTRSMCAEWARHGIQANGIAPGYIRTDLTEALTGGRRVRRLAADAGSGRPLGRARRARRRRRLPRVAGLGLRQRPAAVRRRRAHGGGLVAGGHRIGVDIGGTFTDVVLVGPDWDAAREESALDAGRLCPRRRRRHPRAPARQRGGARRRHQGRARVDRGLECRARGQGLELLPADDGRLSRRPGDAPAADPGHVRAPVREAAAARPAPAALRDPGADRPAGRGVGGAGRECGARGGGACAHRGRGVGRDQLPARVREPCPRAPRGRDRPGGRRRWDLHHLLLRHPRRDPRVRAHEHRGRQRVRRPRRRALPPLARVEPAPPSGSRLRFRSCSPAAA